MCSDLGSDSTGTAASEDSSGVVSLISTEKVMDSDEVSPPSLWTEYNFLDEANPLILSPARPKWLEEVEAPDHEMIKELGSLTKSQLLEKVKELQGIAYQLGLEEAKEMARAKCLGIFEDIEDHLVVSDPTAHGRTEHNSNS